MKESKATKFITSYHNPRQPDSLGGVTEGLEEYFRDPGFDQKMVRESGKQLKSWWDLGFHCSPGSGTRQNLGTECGISFACLSGIWEIVTTQINILAANANQPGEHKNMVSFQVKL